MGFEPMNTEVAALPLSQTWVPLHVFDASRVRTYNHACFTYVTAFKDRKLYLLSYDIMYDGFSHFRVFPCLVIISTTIKPLLSMPIYYAIGKHLGTFFNVVAQFTTWNI